MFILPASAAAYPLTDLASKSSISSWTWLGVRSLFAALFLLAVVRALLAFAVLVRRRPKVAAVDVPAEKEKQPEETSKQSKQAQAQEDQARARWWNGLLAFGLKWETLPPISLAEALPITLHPPPPPAMRGRYVYRGGRGVGFVRRPEPGLAAVGVEASVPVIESQRPASMAKLIMSRHVRRLLPSSPLAFPVCFHPFCPASLSRFVSIPISSFDSICHNTFSFRTFSPFDTHCIPPLSISVSSTLPTIPPLPALSHFVLIHIVSAFGLGPVLLGLCSPPFSPLAAASLSLPPFPTHAPPPTRPCATSHILVMPIWRWRYGDWMSPCISNISLPSLPAYRPPFYPIVFSFLVIVVPLSLTYPRFPAFLSPSLPSHIMLTLTLLLTDLPPPRTTLFPTIFLEHNNTPTRTVEDQRTSARAIPLAIAGGAVKVKVKVATGMKPYGDRWQRSASWIFSGRRASAWYLGRRGPGSDVSVATYTGKAYLVDNDVSASQPMHRPRQLDEGTRA
ncbi:hypothetical protein C8F01DRAFT_274863 [Mycena amicta]|nr:hypothetical protein C8F01DRAFT_274863 [Mycena amicta]